MSGVVAAWKRVVAKRQLPRIGREAKTVDEAIELVRGAIRGDPVLRKAGANHVSTEEALELAGGAMDAARPAMVRVLVRKRLARANTDDQDERFVDELIEQLREQGVL